MSLKKSSFVLRLILSFAFILLLVAFLMFAKMPTWLSLIILLIVSGLLTAHLIFSLRKQLSLISQTTLQIAKGNHTLRFPELNFTELNTLSADLNGMLEKLDKTIHHLAVHREELRLVLSTIDDILWSQSLEGKLEWVNLPFQDIFGKIDTKKKIYYWEVIRDPILLSFIKNTASSKDKLLQEAEIEGHYYLFSSTHNDKAKRRVFILQNIDEIRQVEQIKKDFIVNLAHELRTPLTAISGFAEAMEENINEANRNYLKIIQNHTLRLVHLISDLEQLIRLESIKELEFQDTNLATFFQNIALILTPMVEEKGLYLNIELDENLPRLICDPFKLEQVFINLVQNSLRYTTQGGITIRSRLATNEALFEVSDTGIGIDNIHLPRIFERFYVADPARNKSQSGTGLGLAIVKHIVQLHNGSITVKSELGTGTVFSILLPLTQPHQLENND
ncbi:MAG: ATP-binding protein [Candidatus Cloacimonas sp.]